MDEPLSNLDAKLRVAMRTDLKKIHNELKSTSIFVTHDQSEALSLADRIVVMNQGFIEQIGTPNEIYHDSDSMFIAKFIGSPPSNFFIVNVIEKGDKIILVHSTFEYEYKGPSIKKIQEEYVGKTVVLSVRPEQITVNNKGFIDVIANIVEPQGSHVIINTTVNNEPIKIVSELIDLKEGQKINIGFTNQVSLFDPTTERKIR